MTAANDPLPGEVSQAVRDYLGAIEWLGGNQLPVTTQRIARRLGVSCPSVTNMVKRLYARGLVSYQPYHGVRLTAAGSEIVAAARRRRRLLERYLAERLGYAPDVATLEASRLEAGVTDALERHIEASLSSPKATGSGAPRFAAVVGTVDSPFAADSEHLA